MASTLTPPVCQSCSGPGHWLCICDNFAAFICVPCSKAHCQTHSMHHFIPSSYKPFLAAGGTIEEAKKKVQQRDKGEREVRERVAKFHTDAVSIERLIEDAEKGLQDLKDRKRKEFQDISESFQAKCSSLFTSFFHPSFPPCLDLPVSELDLSPHIHRSPYDINLALAPILSAFCAAHSIHFSAETCYPKVTDGDRKRSRKGDKDQKLTKRPKKTEDMEET